MAKTYIGLIINKITGISIINKLIHEIYFIIINHVI